MLIEVVQTMRLFSQRVAGTESLFRVQCIAFRCVTLCDVTIHHRRYCNTLIQDYRITHGILVALVE